MLFIKRKTTHDGFSEVIVGEIVVKSPYGYLQDDLLHVAGGYLLQQLHRGLS